EFHEREFAKRGGVVEMVQLWVNLPARDKKTAPRYQTLRAATIPTVALAAGVEARLIAGELSGARGPAQTFSPVDLWDLTIAAGASATLPRVQGRTAAVFVRHGSLRVGDDVTIGAGELVVLPKDGTRVELTTQSDTGALFLGGEPIREPIVGYGPFVMNTKAEIAAAFDDYEHGRMGHLRD
ncbi:MAG: pirin family protein, partial [Planctomycetes bacterium]|nr:pirin family protein [Planctomycetota bacterium]